MNEMSPVRIDFHPGAGRRPRWAAWSALAVAAVLAAWAGQRLARDEDALAALQARHDLLDARLHPGIARSTAPGPELARRIAADNEVIDTLAVPWGELFRAVESADARGLGVTALVPDAHEHSLHLTGEARSVPDALAYVERLGRLRVLEHVRLQGYETVARDGVDVVTFSVAATWQPR